MTTQEQTSKESKVKTKVIARLVKWGWNEDNAQSMTDEHFEYAYKYYSGVSKIAEVISSL